MTGGSRRFRREDRLRSSKDFRRVSREGRRVSSRTFVLLWAPSWPSADVGPRLGVTVSRAVGNAVVRNRIKRGIREWFRTSGDAPQGSDLVVIARARARELSAGQVIGELEVLSRQAREAGTR